MVRTRQRENEIHHPYYIINYDQKKRFEDQHKVTDRDISYYKQGRYSSDRYKVNEAYTNNNKIPDKVPNIYLFGHSTKIEDTGTGTGKRVSSLDHHVISGKQMACFIDRSINKPIFFETQTIIWYLSCYSGLENEYTRTQSLARNFALKLTNLEWENTFVVGFRFKVSRDTLNACKLFTKNPDEENFLRSLNGWIWSNELRDKVSKMRDRSNKRYLERLRTEHKLCSLIKVGN